MGWRGGEKITFDTAFPSGLSFWKEQPRGDTFKGPSSRPLGLGVPAQEVWVTRTEQCSNLGLANGPLLPLSPSFGD